jgi:aminoglycoside phosphotransferase (APT) family kinase protein
MNADTIPVRSGEELDTASLAAYLQTHPLDLPCSASADSTAIASPQPDEIQLEQFAGGHSNLTYLLRIKDQEVVLRRPPLGPVAPTAHDMPREYRLLKALHPHFNLAPRPLLLCEDPAVLGTPFYLMERRRGLIIQRQLPAILEEDLSLRRRISEAMIDTLAALHRIDIYQTGLANIGKPAGFVTRQLRGWSQRWQQAQTTPLPLLEQTITWLEQHLPVDNPQQATFLHNDFKLDNVMLSLTDPTKLVAVFDWEMSTVGDPLIDLGIFLGYWAEKDDHEARRKAISPVTTLPGWLTRQELIARYQEKTGRDLSNITFYEVFAIFKTAVVLQQIYFRYVRGQTQDPRFKDFGRWVAGLAEVTATLIDKAY